MADCYGTCWALCGSNCSGQSGGGCIMCGGGIADGSCSCGHDCSGCGGGCTGTSKPSGDDGGGGGCTCGGNCTSGCDSTCSGECTASCGTGCYGEEATNLFNKLKAGLNKKILAEDMNNINKMIQLEANRRKKDTAS